MSPPPALPAVWKGRVAGLFIPSSCLGSPPVETRAVEARIDVGSASAPRVPGVWIPWRTGGVEASWWRHRGAVWAAGWDDLDRWVRAAVARRCVRPRLWSTPQGVAGRWALVPDPSLRHALLTLLTLHPSLWTGRAQLLIPSSPPSPPTGRDRPAAVDGSRWDLVRACADALADRLLSEAVDAGPLAADASPLWSAMHRALGSAPQTAVDLVTARRLARSSARWEGDETPLLDAPALHLWVGPAAEGTGLQAEVTLGPRSKSTGDTGTSEGHLPVSALTAGRLEVHRWVDHLPPLRPALEAALAELVRRAPSLVLGVESPHRRRVTVSPAEAWALLSSSETWPPPEIHRTVAPELSGIERRVVRGVLSLARTDGRTADTSTLDITYRAQPAVEVDGETVSAAELRSLATGGGPLVRLPSGRWAVLDPGAVPRLGRIAQAPPQEWSGTRALASALAGEVRVWEWQTDLEVRPDAGLQAVVESLGRTPDPVDPSPLLQATLRPYQREGVAWLWHRTERGLGALLADDMGLGKTIQLIALGLRWAETGLIDAAAPLLLVCPASLLGNWEREWGRFAPSIRVHRHHDDGRARDAASLLQAAQGASVVLTTYATLRRDAAWLSACVWGALVADEAQALKSPRSDVWTAVRSLPARRRVLLTGTPVENRLTDLWALLELVNPGLLGPLEVFQRTVAGPLERGGDARAERVLRAATRPFVLRRRKTDPELSTQLPPKIVSRTLLTLTDEQASLYRQSVERGFRSLDHSTGQERHGRVLAMLTELKQVCNHPALVAEGEVDLERLAGRSSKFDRVVDLVDSIADAGEKVLLFTQFLRMGEWVAGALARRRGCPVDFLHGGVPVLECDRMVDRFQSADGPPALVISLKAGGAGLNLTAASHVIHVDRWWNPAVEDQATDRAHRLGQTQRVLVHHLIAAGTLEEHIDRLLESKRALAERTLAGGPGWLTDLSTDELRALVSLGSDAQVGAVRALGRRGEHIHV